MHTDQKHDKPTLLQPAYATTLTDGSTYHSTKMAKNRNHET